MFERQWQSKARRRHLYVHLLLRFFTHVSFTARNVLPGLGSLFRALLKFLHSSRCSKNSSKWEEFAFFTTLPCYVSSLTSFTVCNVRVNFGFIAFGDKMECKVSREDLLGRILELPLDFRFKSKRVTLPSGSVVCHLWGLMGLQALGRRGTSSPASRTLNCRKAEFKGRTEYSRGTFLIASWMSKLCLLWIKK